jgi:hypothetical protein
MRLTVRRMMIFVAVMSFAFAAYRLAGELRYWTMSYGWNTSVLPLGLEVRIIQGVQLDDWTIPTGTRGVIVSDPPDEDSAYPYREVGVRFSEGPGKGRTIYVRRTLLRAY